MARLEHDREADAVYVYLGEDRAVARTVRLAGDTIRTVDYDAEGAPVGVEFLEASGGLDLGGVPEAEAILRLADEHRLKVFA